MAAADRRMLHSDAFAWYMEADPVLRSTIVAVALLDRAPDWPYLRYRIDRLTRLVPQLRERVLVPPLRVGPPRWAVDEAFDLDYHLRRVALPSPGRWEDVLEVARVAAMTSFDRARPLWEFTVLEELPEGRTALLTKLHHSVADGIGGIQLAALTVDFSPDRPDLGPLPEPPSGHPVDTVTLTARSVRDDAAEAAGLAARVLRGLPGAGVHALRHPLDAAAQVARTGTSVARIVEPIRNPLSTALADRRTTRRLATIDVPFATLHEAAMAAGGHLNDAYLAAVAGGLHRYHRRGGAELARMRVGLPVSIRRPDDPVGGNRITILRFAVPAGLPDPGERVRQISDIVRRWRAQPGLALTQGIAFGLNLVPRAYIGNIFKRVEVLASDVPGLDQPVYLGGARMLAYYPFGPTIGAAFNTTLLSYAGTCHVGVNIDSGAVRDPALLVECLEEGFAEVCTLAEEVSGPVPHPSGTFG